jgi:predicted phosphodiesterase
VAPETIGAEVKALRAAGFTTREIAKKLGVHRGRVMRAMRKLGLSEQVPSAISPAVEPLPPLADRLYVDKGDEAKEYVFPVPPEGRILLIPDTHAPYHSQKAWSAMVAYARRWRPSAIIHVGDFVDCYAVSAHDKNPRRMSQLEDEIKLARELREQLDSLGAARKIIALGNHEDRLRRYIIHQASALSGLVDIPTLLQLPDNNWDVVPYQRHGSIGKLHFTHDTARSGVNAVRFTGNDFNASVAFGHSHRADVHYFGDVLGNRHVSINLGWLGDVEAIDYCHRVQATVWQHAFGLAYMEPSGLFRVELVPIVDGRVIAP